MRLPIRGSVMAVAQCKASREAPPVVLALPELSRLQTIGRFCRRHPRLPLFGLVIVVLFGACLLAPLIAPFDPKETNTQVRLAGPGRPHIMGTDQLGRDTFSRVLYGGRIAIPLDRKSTRLNSSHVEISYA